MFVCVCTYKWCTLGNVVIIKTRKAGICVLTGHVPV